MKVETWVGVLMTWTLAMGPVALADDAPTPATPAEAVDDAPDATDDGAPEADPEGAEAPVEPAETETEASVPDGPPPPADTPVTFVPSTPIRAPAVLGGRIVSYSAWGALAVGGAAFGTSFALERYDYRGPWYDKWKYDRAFEARRAAAEPVRWTGVALMGSSIPLSVIGAVVEGQALRRFVRVPTGSGWVSVGLLSAGAGLFSGGLAVGATPLWIPGAVLLHAAWVMSTVQLGIDVEFAKKLDDEQRALLYHPHRVKVIVVPQVSLDRYGASLVGVF